GGPSQRQPEEGRWPGCPATAVARRCSYAARHPVGPMCHSAGRATIRRRCGMNGTFVDCPAYREHIGWGRGALPAEVEDRDIMWSTDGPLESTRIRCPRGHWFSGPV